MGNSRRTWVILNMAIRSPRFHRCVRENRRICFIRGMLKPFHELRIEFLHLFERLGVAAQDGMGCFNNIFKMWPDKRFVQGEKILGVRVVKDRFR